MTNQSPKTASVTQAFLFTLQKTGISSFETSLRLKACGYSTRWMRSGLILKSPLAIPPNIIKSSYPAQQEDWFSAITSLLYDFLNHRIFLSCIDFSTSSFSCQLDIVAVVPLPTFLEPAVTCLESLLIRVFTSVTLQIFV